MNGIIWLISGILIGMLVYRLCMKFFTNGIIEIDQSDPELPYLRLNLTDESLDRIPNKKYVLFKVDSKATFTRQKHSL